MIAGQAALEVRPSSNRQVTQSPDRQMADDRTDKSEAQDTTLRCQGTDVRIAEGSRPRRVLPDNHLLQAAAQVEVQIAEFKAHERGYIALNIAEAYRDVDVVLAALAVLPKVQTAG